MIRNFLIFYTILMISAVVLPIVGCGPSAKPTPLPPFNVKVLEIYPQDNGVLVNLETLENPIKRLAIHVTNSPWNGRDIQIPLKDEKWEVEKGNSDGHYRFVKIIK